MSLAWGKGKSHHSNKRPTTSKRNHLRVCEASCPCSRPQPGPRLHSSLFTSGTTIDLNSRKNNRRRLYGSYRGRSKRSGCRKVHHLVEATVGDLCTELPPVVSLRPSCSVLADNVIFIVDIELTLRNAPTSRPTARKRWSGLVENILMNDSLRKALHRLYPTPDL